MLIISKFKDYYDTAIAYGVDKECVYNRNTEEVRKPKRTYDDTTEFKTKNYTYDITPHTIGFCGDIYRMVKIHVINNYDELDEKILGFYDAESLIKYMKEQSIDFKVKNYNWRSWYRNSWKTEKEIKQYYNIEINQSDYELFRKYHTPVFVKDYNYTYINPCLKDYKFAKIKDAYSAFQDIYQYMAGVLGNNEKETVDVLDKTRVKQYGFNDWSFRTHKEESKKNKKKNK